MTSDQELQMIDDAKKQLSRAFSILYRLEREMNEHTVNGFYADLNLKVNSLEVALEKRKDQIQGV